MRDGDKVTESQIQTVGERERDTDILDIRARPPTLWQGAHLGCVASYFGLCHRGGAKSQLQMQCLATSIHQGGLGGKANALSEGPISPTAVR